MLTQADLDNFASTMSIRPSTVTPALGEAIIAEVTPLPNQLPTTDIATVPLDVDWHGKSFEFVNATIGDLTRTGPLQAFNFTQVPPTALAGVPGLIGKLTGQLQIPIPLVVDVTVRVDWKITDGTNDLVRGEDYLAGPDLVSPRIEILLGPIPGEHGTALQGVARYLEATVTLSAIGIESNPTALPAVKLTAPSLPVPTVLAMGRNTSLGGAMLVMTPNGSPLSTLQLLVTFLADLRGAIAPLASLATLAAFVLGVDTLVQRLQNEGHIQFRSMNGHDNLNSITLIQREWWKNDTEAEDELSSALLLGVNGKQVRFFIDRNRSGDNLTLRVGPKLVAQINDLHSNRPTSAPDGDEVVGVSGSSSFGNEISSLTFL